MRMIMLNCLINIIKSQIVQNIIQKDLFISYSNVSWKFSKKELDGWMDGWMRESLQHKASTYMTERRDDQHSNWGDVHLRHRMKQLSNISLNVSWLVAWTEPGTHWLAVQCAPLTELPFLNFLRRGIGVSLFALTWSVLWYFVHN